MARTSYISILRWYFVLDQHAQLCFSSASLQKQQSVCRLVAFFGHIAMAWFQANANFKASQREHTNHYAIDVVKTTDEIYTIFGGFQIHLHISNNRYVNDKLC